MKRNPSWWWACGIPFPVSISYLIPPTSLLSISGRQIMYPLARQVSLFIFAQYYLWLGLPVPLVPHSNHCQPVPKVIFLHTAQVIPYKGIQTGNLCITAYIYNLSITLQECSKRVHMPTSDYKVLLLARIHPLPGWTVSPQPDLHCYTHMIENFNVGVLKKWSRCARMAKLHQPQLQLVWHSQPPLCQTEYKDLPFLLTRSAVAV